MRWRSFAVGILAIGPGLCTGFGAAEGAGPWRGQVVDAETGQPISGVVILAEWRKRSPGFIHSRVEFYDAEEAVTDREGRFVVPARSTRALNPLVTIEGPILHMFKSGYGRWRFRGSAGWGKLDLAEHDRLHNEAWMRFEGPGAVFELPPSRTREERLKSLSEAWPWSKIPDSRMRRYLRALDDEREALGLQPSGRGK